MPNYLRNFAAVLLLLLVPLQGISASFLSVQQCPTAVTNAAESPDIINGGDTERGDDSAFHEHSFCHQSPSGIPAVSGEAAMKDSPVFEFSASRLSSLFSPEQPQRPPFSVSA
ncbi:MAG: hypothetical protein HYY78_03020 [Betaproteobacteria bacterium]|nr:hypothetical protein [Betaproteobacteria bacterium]